MGIILQLCQKIIWEQSHGAGDVRYLKGVGISTYYGIGEIYHNGEQIWRVVGFLIF